MYEGVPKDYTGKDVTPENFLHVLKGEQGKVPRGKKVIKSGPKDNIFVYFSDHGAPNLIAFPRGELWSKQLIGATKEMNHQKKFNKMVYYIEVRNVKEKFNYDSEVDPTKIIMMHSISNLFNFFISATSHMKLSQCPT